MDQHVKEEDGKVTFSCTFCKPEGKLRWFKGRSEIFHGFKIHFENDGAEHRITINKLNPDDSGKYTCKVNDIETSAELFVTRNKSEFYFLLICRAPMFTKKKQKVIEGTTDYQTLPKETKRSLIIKITGYKRLPKVFKGYKMLLKVINDH